MQLELHAKAGPPTMVATVSGRRLRNQGGIREQRHSAATGAFGQAGPGGDYSSCQGNEQGVAYASPGTPREKPRTRQISNFRLESKDVCTYVDALTTGGSGPISNRVQRGFAEDRRESFIFVKFSLARDSREYYNYIVYYLNNNFTGLRIAITNGDGNYWLS